MANEQLQKDIKHFEYVTKDKFEVMQNLLNKGYNEADIIEEFDSYHFKSEWHGNILGFFMIGLAILIVFNIQSTFGSFSYRFNSQGDFFRLNEWVFKPFLILALLFTGINTIINKGFINKNLKLAMIVIFSLFLITSLISNSPLSLLIAVIGIILFSLYKIVNANEFSSAQMLINEIKNGNKNSKKVLKKISIYEKKVWNGSSVFLFLLLSFCLFLNSPIEITREIITQTENSTSYKASLQNIDIILFYGNHILLVLSFIMSVLLNINLKKFRKLLFGIMVLSAIYIITAFFHSNFQVSIFPALIIIIAGIIAVTKHDLLLSKNKITTENL